ncbi:MAG: CBS domain-containing protein [Deltaproteobacteria bacterium]|jgi:predicted transcriptional regulator|nr:CBS domain-containing protein [Deltaproteobacteria bacterium]
MERDYTVVDGVATVAEALAILRERSAHFLVVARRHEDDEFGMVMVADIAKQVLARNRSPERTNVYEIMSKPVLSVKPEMDIRYCARLFHRFGISAAPVIEGDEIKGVVAYDQLVLKGLAGQP